MTAQIPDEYIYDEKEYSIVAMSEPINFNPKEYGLNPIMLSTDCRRGYQCTYLIKDDNIFLNKLYVSTMGENVDFPSINGIKPNVFEAKKDSGFYHLNYDNINKEIEYTGKILLGSEFDFNYYIHMGYQRAWAYNKLIELTFEQGVLLDISDQSEMAEKLRQQITDNPQAFKEKNIMKFVEDSFSLDFAAKAWWLL